MVCTYRIRLIPRQEEQVSLEKGQDVSDHGVQPVIPNLPCQLAGSGGQMSELDFRPIIYFTCWKISEKSTSPAPAHDQLTAAFGETPERTQRNVTETLTISTTTST